MLIYAKSTRKNSVITNVVYVRKCFIYAMSIFLSIFLILAIILIVLLAYAKHWNSNNGRCPSDIRLDGKTCLVTGGTNGIGLEIAIELAKRGARVIVACPFQEEGSFARKKIVEQSGNSNVIYKFLDLASFKNVRKFAADILNTEHRLDILMNNAGVGAPPHDTEDGFNMAMQVNYLGHFLLTLLLLPLLKKSGTPSVPSRIVNTSSVKHRFAELDIDDLATPVYSYNKKIIRYSNSKLCLVLFSRELMKRMTHSNVVINNADPGAVSTKIFLDAGHFQLKIMYILFKWFAKSSYEGAQTPLFVALDEEAGKASGQFYIDCKVSESSKVSQDEDLAKRLWDKTTQLVKLEDEEINSLLQ